MDVGGIPQRGLPDRGWPDRGLPAAGEGFAVKLKKSPSGLAPCIANDYLGLKVWNGTAIVQNGWKVVSVSDPGGGYDYVNISVTRVYGSIATFPEGAAVVNYGQADDGFVKITADESYAPFIDIATWSGDDPWTGTVTPHTRQGNLDGVLGLSEQWGLAAGKDLSDDTEPHVIISDQQVGLFGVAQTWWDSGGNARAEVDPTAGDTDKLFWAGLSSSDPRFIVYGDGTTWLSTLAISSDVGAMFFSQADGLALWGPGCAVDSTSWTSTRGQVATISGAFHQDAGRWPGTRGLRIEEAGENYEPAPRMIEDGSTGLAAGWAYTDNLGSGGSATKDIVEHPVSERGWLQRLAYTGAAGDVNDWCQVYDYTATGSFAQGDSVTVSLDVKGVLSGCFFQIHVYEVDVSDVNGTVHSDTSFSVTSNLQRVEATFTTVDADCSKLLILLRVATINDGDTLDIWLGAVNCEKKAYSTSFCCGALDYCSWSGTADASTSTRTATECNLDAHVGLVSGNGTLSVAMWVQMPYDSDATWPDGVSYLQTITTGAIGEFLLSYQSSGGYNDTFQVLYDANLITTSAQTFLAGDWIHIVVTIDCDNNIGKIYLDGTLDVTDTGAMVAQTATDWTVGGYTGAESGCNVCEYAVFNCVLTASEAAALRQRGAPLVDTGALETPGVYILDGRFSLVSSTTGEHTEITAAGIGIYDGTGPTGVGRILGGFVNTTSKELDITSDDLGWFGYDASNVLQVAWYGSGSNAGKIVAGAGKIVIDEDAITMNSLSNYNLAGLRFIDGSDNEIRVFQESQVLTLSNEDPTASGALFEFQYYVGSWAKALIISRGDVCGTNYGLTTGAIATFGDIWGGADVRVSGGLYAGSTAVNPSIGTICFTERSSDPTEPAEGATVIWMSDGTGKGDDGDVMIASKAGGTTKYATLFDFSAGSAW